mgnify:CR=1 FL=1
MARTGLTFRQIDHWCRREYLIPLPREVESSGVPREFPSGELQIALRMRDLINCGFTVPVAAKLARGDKSLMMLVDLTLAAVRVSTS